MSNWLTEVEWHNYIAKALSIFKQVQRMEERHGIDNLHLHKFRHSRSTHALANGCDIATVKHTLGHASIATTNQSVHPDQKIKLNEPGSVMRGGAIKQIVTPTSARLTISAI